MQIILKENVENLGFKDDLVNVKNGFGRNYLIPQGKAVLATTSAKKVLAENLKQKAFKELNHKSFKISEEIHKSVISIPCGPHLTDKDVKKVITVCNSY